MTQILVVFQTEDDKSEITLNDVLLDSTLRDAREPIKMLFGLPESLSCRFLLVRTGQILRDNETFKEADVKHGDIIRLVFNDQAIPEYQPNVLPNPRYPKSEPPDITVSYTKQKRTFIKSLSIFLKKTKKLVFSLVTIILVLMKKLSSHKRLSLVVFLMIFFLLNPGFESTRTIWGMKLGIVKNVQGKNLNGVSLERANLTNVNMVGTKLNGAQLYQSNLSDAILSKASLAAADLRGVNFSRADLTETNLNKANLLGANLQGANLRKAKITDPETGEITTKLDSNARLAWEIVNEPKTGRDLESKKLDRYNLSYANLKNAVLSHASLTWVDLSKANLEGATLYKADLTGTNLKGAILKGVNLTGASLYRVKTDNSTICPNGKPGSCKF